MDGAETARILRERFDIPVVYLTAHADRDTLERAKHSQAAGLHREAVSRGRVAASVEMALYKHGHDRRSRSREQHVTDAITNHNHIQTMDAGSFESF
jgi:CheY-like chemotaxis protein